MGTSYNDDGGLVSGDLETIKMDYEVLEELEYTDCFNHSQCYLFRNSKNVEKEIDIKLKGLASYALEEETDFMKETAKLIANEFGVQLNVVEGMQHDEKLFNKVLEK
jgi:hypothetical protein